MEQMYSLRKVSSLLDIPIGEVRTLGRKAGIAFFVVGDSPRINESGLGKLVNFSSGENIMPQMYSLNKASELLDISSKTLRRLIVEKNVPTYRVGANIRLKQSDLLILIEKQKTLEDY